MDPKIVGPILQGHHKQDPRICRNSPLYLGSMLCAARVLGDFGGVFRAGRPGCVVSGTLVSLGIQVYKHKQYLLWGLKYVHNTYFGLPTVWVLIWSYGFQQPGTVYYAGSERQRSLATLPDRQNKQKQCVTGCEICFHDRSSSLNPTHKSAN